MNNLYLVSYFIVINPPKIEKGNNVWTHHFYLTLHWRCQPMIIQEKEVKNIQIAKEDITLFADIIAYIENPKKSTKNPLELTK